MQHNWAGWIIFGLLAITIVVLFKWLAKIGVLIILLLAALYWLRPRQR